MNPSKQTAFENEADVLEFPFLVWKQPSDIIKPQLKKLVDFSQISSSSLVPIQPFGSKTPLFGVHADNGDVLFYKNLSMRLGLDQPFYGLQAKGIMGDETPLSQIEKMANHYINEIRRVQPEGPYYLAGYCFGARIAFEMAQQLTQQGQKVALLANFNGTSYHHTANVTDDKISQNIFARASRHLRNIIKLSSKEKISYISILLKKEILRGSLFSFGFKLNGLVFKSYLLFKRKAPAGVTRVYVNQSLHFSQSKYKPKTYNGTMVIFRSPGIYIDNYLGWRSLVKGKITTFDVPGKHETRKVILNEPFVRVVARDLRNFLDN